MKRISKTTIRELENMSKNGKVIYKDYYYTMYYIYTFRLYANNTIKYNISLIYITLTLNHDRPFDLQVLNWRTFIDEYTSDVSSESGSKIVMSDETRILFYSNEGFISRLADLLDRTSAR